MDYMDYEMYGFFLHRFLEKESAQRAAARNPKGDKSGRGLASLRAAVRTCLWIRVCGTPVSELWLLNTANRREKDPRPGPDTLATERFGRPPAASWAFIGAPLGLKTASLGLKTAPRQVQDG